MMKLGHSSNSMDDWDILALCIYQLILGVLFFLIELYTPDSAINGARFYFTFRGRAFLFIYLAIPIVPLLQKENWYIGATGIMLLGTAVILFVFSFTKYPFPQKEMLSTSPHGTNDIKALLAITTLENK